MAHCTVPHRKLSMRLGRVIPLIAALPLGLLCMSPSWADTCTGNDVNMIAPGETTDFGHGLKQTSLKAKSVLLSGNSLYNLVAGECVGIMLQTPDGKTQLEGY